MAGFPFAMFGLELYAGERKVFHPVQGCTLKATCPRCGREQGDDYAGEFMSNGFYAVNDFPRCKGRGAEQHINASCVEQDWGFSNIGFTMWTFPGVPTAGFLREMRALFGTEAVGSVYVRI